MMTMHINVMRIPQVSYRNKLWMMEIMSRQIFLRLHNYVKTIKFALILTTPLSSIISKPTYFQYITTRDQRKKKFQYFDNRSWFLKQYLHRTPDRLPACLSF
jgi:hypothetical protein